MDVELDKDVTFNLDAVSSIVGERKYGSAAH
jgi:hypothetical protein